MSEAASISPQTPRSSGRGIRLGRPPTTGKVIRLSDAARRLRSLREAKGYESARSAAMQMGVSVTTYCQHESARRTIGKKAAERYAQHFGVATGFILFGEQLHPGKVVSIVGVIGPGGIVAAVSDGLKETIVAPPGLGHETLAGLRVVGSELYPAYHAGDIVYFDADALAAGKISEHECDGRECVVIGGDGVMRVRMLIVGRLGITLIQHNGPPETAADVRAATPVLWVKRNIE